MNIKAIIFDVDGTLAPIVPRPEEAAVPARAAAGASPVARQANHAESGTSAMPQTICAARSRPSARPTVSAIAL